MNIKKIKVGSVVTRYKPNLRQDRSYIGDKLILNYMTEKMICLKRINESEIEILGKEILLPLAEWSEGWEILETKEDRAIFTGEFLNVGDLKQILSNYKDNTPVNLRHQLPQKLYELNDNGKVILFFQ